ncbi:hypothetical protein [Marinitenerispora sediminis]|uniref:hypothetical protein n=1 Tax=Marinitenerispora sediminis TaxID=1931232 RepID=UPI001F17C9AC|nr:hypothetical protein [Marinitenerispora sediminis]
MQRVINMLVNQRIEFSPTQIAPIAVGLMAGGVLVLMGTRSAVAWCGPPGLPAGPRDTGAPHRPG